MSIGRNWGKFRKNHPAVGAGTHQKISDAPYAFNRTLKQNDFEDNVLVVMAQDGKRNSGKRCIPRKSRSQKFLYWGNLHG